MMPSGCVESRPIVIIVEVNSSSNIFIAVDADCLLHQMVVLCRMPVILNAGVLPNRHNIGYRCIFSQHRPFYAERNLPMLLG